MIIKNDKMIYESYDSIYGSIKLFSIGGVWITFLLSELLGPISLVIFVHGSIREKKKKPK